MASVQFYGIDSVLTAAENRGCSCWGIWINGRMFSKYESINVAESLQMLRQNLEVLEESNANAIYTLKFFECDGKTAVKIKEKTECDGGSFNFKLIETDERLMGAHRVSSNNSAIVQMQQQLAAIQEQLNGDDEEEEPETIGSVLLDLIKKPAELAQLVNIFRAATGLPVQNIAGLSGIRPALDAPAAAEATEEEKLQNMANALDTLEKNDPHFSDHVQKLAAMAKDNPEQFKTLLNFL